MSSLIPGVGSLVVDSATVSQHDDSRSPASAIQKHHVAPLSICPVVDANVYGHLGMFNIFPLSALELLCAHLNNIVEITGDVPLSPSRSAAVPQSEQEGSRGLIWNEDESSEAPEFHCVPVGNGNGNVTVQEIEQQNALIKRFYSKKAPPIALGEYMLRLHKYCPMSTAIYLATSVYINKMALNEKIILVTPRNVHRLVLAGLRVAMKALEDLSYPHNRFAKVGGVSERELTRLEIAFCFLANFDLRVDSQLLGREAESLWRSTAPLSKDFELNLDLLQLPVATRG
jgi:hypothetical protein